jgi:hypothetical protein
MRLKRIIGKIKFLEMFNPSLFGGIIRGPYV